MIINTLKKLRIFAIEKDFIVFHDKLYSVTIASVVEVALQKPYVIFEHNNAFYCIRLSSAFVLDMSCEGSHMPQSRKQLYQVILRIRDQDVDVTELMIDVDAIKPDGFDEKDDTFTKAYLELLIQVRARTRLLFSCIQ